MTFDEYNTDDNFDKDKSSLEELVKIGIGEGKSSDDIRKSLSPKWQKSKKIGEFDNYVKQFSATPKVEEEKPTEEKILDKVITASAPQSDEKKTTLDNQTKDFMNKNNDIANTQEDNEYERQKKELFTKWDLRNENIDKMSNSMRRIDDHMVEQLPTFMFKRYQNGEFGDPKTSDAKLRLAHFMINGLGTALSNMGHKINKDGQIEESDFQKYQRTNLEQGLENRWNKYKQETQSALDIAKQGGMSEEALTDSIATISSNNRLQSVFNQMNERQKVFALQVLGEIGNKMGNMNDAQFANTLMGMSAMGDSLDYKEAAGMLLYRFIKDPEKRDAALKDLGLLGGGKTAMAGLGMGLFGGGNNEETETTLEDGTKIDPGKTMNNEEYQKLLDAANNLSQQYFDGKIDEAKFRSEYAKLEKIMGEHGWYSFFHNKGLGSADDLIKKNNQTRLLELDEQFSALNQKAKNGEIKPADYEEQFKALKAQATKWGATEQTLKYIDKEKISSDKIIKAAEKKAKKKK